MDAPPTPPPSAPPTAHPSTATTPAPPAHAQAPAPAQQPPLQPQPLHAQAHNQAQPQPGGAHPHPHQNPGTGNGSVSLAGLLNQITSAHTSLPALAHTLRTCAPPDVRDTILAGVLPGGQDPLDVLDVAVNSLGVLWILSARLGVNAAAAPVQPRVIDEFCARFTPEQVHAAPERVTVLAKGIVRYAEGMYKPKYAIGPLKDLLTRFPPSLAHLTPLHAIFITTCLKHSHTPPALLRPILSVPLAYIGAPASASAPSAAHGAPAAGAPLCPDLVANDALVYLYGAGCVCAAWKDWENAEEFFEMAVGAPGQAASALQWEALKKLALVQCIARGTTTPLPKYVHPALARMLKNSAYGAFVRAYPRQPAQLRELLEKEGDAFHADRNRGLVQQALERAARWHVRRLPDTYLTLSLPDIARAVGLPGADAARAVVVSMVEAGELAARLAADGTVTFAEAAKATVTRADVDRVLRAAQAQAAQLAALEREVGASREYLAKAVKTRDEDRWAAAGGGGAGDMDDSVFGGGAGAQGGWAEETMFA